MENIKITCSISTKDRYYTTLSHTLMGVLNQTYLPWRLILWDDGEFKDLRGDPLYSHIFSLLQFKFNGRWEHNPGGKQGQVFNHIQTVKKADTEFVWRLDDDNVPESDVLEKLVKNIKDDVGAIGGLVVPSNNIQYKPSIASNKMEDIYLGLNEQWFITNDKVPKEVEHLYSSFLYRKSIAEYNTNLSKIGHREETLLTHSFITKGYKNILDPTAITWHLCNPVGGIRDGQREDLGRRDEGVFVNYLINNNIKPNDYSFVVLDNGIGDHFAFKSNIQGYLDANKDKKKILFVANNEVFKDIPDVQLASIYDAEVLFGKNLDRFSMYKYCWDNNWKKNIESAYPLLYNFKYDRAKNVINGTGDYVLISPYSSSGMYKAKNPNFVHAKNYPYWNSLTKRIKELGLKTIQICVGDEKKIDSADEFLLNLSFKEIEQLIEKCKFWMSIDSFLPHLVNCMKDIVKGVAIFGPSDPKIFGYGYNLNILKSDAYLRKLQFDDWSNEKIPFDNNVFLDPDKTFKEIKTFFSI